MKKNDNIKRKNFSAMIILFGKLFNKWDLLQQKYFFFRNEKYLRT